VPGEDQVHLLFLADDLPGVDLDVGSLPLSPAARITAAADAAIPMQGVITSGLMCCIVSYIPIIDERRTLPAAAGHLARPDMHL
jgi:hypothetical protein